MMNDVETARFAAQVAVAEKLESLENALEGFESLQLLAEGVASPDGNRLDIDRRQLVALLDVFATRLRADLQGAQASFDSLVRDHLSSEPGGAS